MWDYGRKHTSEGIFVKEWKTKSINSCSYVSITSEEEVVCSLVRNKEMAKQPRIID